MLTTNKYCLKLDSGRDRRKKLLAIFIIAHSREQVGSSPKKREFGVLYESISEVAYGAGKD